MKIILIIFTLSCHNFRVNILKNKGNMCSKKIFTDKELLILLKEKRSYEIITTLQNCNKIEFSNDYGYEIFHILSLTSNEQLIKAIINKCNINQLIEGATLLQRACKEGNYNIAKLLIENKADINIKDSFNKTPLCYVCENGSCNTANLLLKNNADTEISIEYNNEKIPLMHYAYFNNKIGTLHSLIEYGANINAIDYNSKTLLHYVCEANNIDLVKFLLQNNADINLKDMNGNTSLDIANMQENKNILNLLNYEK